MYLGTQIPGLVQRDVRRHLFVVSYCTANHAVHHLVPPIPLPTLSTYLGRYPSYHAVASQDPPQSANTAEEALYLPELYLGTYSMYLAGDEGRSIRAVLDAAMPHPSEIVDVQ